jgi:hypothetical protein
MVPVFVHVEPAPDTVAVPREPGKSPTNPPKSDTVPPSWTSSIPLPISPMARFRASAPGIATTVEFGVTVSMIAWVVFKGRFPTQLSLLNQSLDNSPFQSDWACAETDAPRSAIVARNVGTINLQPPRARDVASRHAASCVGANLCRAQENTPRSRRLVQGCLIWRSVRGSTPLFSNGRCANAIRHACSTRAKEPEISRPGRGDVSTQRIHRSSFSGILSPPRKATFYSQTRHG